MYGVPADLDLSFLHGAEVIQICLGQYQVQLHFAPLGSIFVQGGWELRDVTGGLVERSENGPPQHLGMLLGKHVVGTEVRAPKEALLRFENGQSLCIFDDSDSFESFEIQPGGIIV